MNCCYNCDNRAVGCHSRCESYLAYKDGIEEQKRIESRGIEYAKYVRISKARRQKAK